MWPPTTATPVEQRDLAEGRAVVDLSNRAVLSVQITIAAMIAYLIARFGLGHPFPLVAIIGLRVFSICRGAQSDGPRDYPLHRDFTRIAKPFHDSCA